MKKMSRDSQSTVILSAAGILFLFISFFLLREFFITNILTDFTIEILAAVIGSIIVVISMAIMMRFQSQQDMKREFTNKVFEEKLSIYKELLTLVFTADDDNRITKDEILSIENQLGIACLVANAELVRCFSQFILQIKKYEVIYFHNMSTEDRENFAHFLQDEKKTKLLLNESDDELERYFVSLDDLVQEIRDDLAVVSGDVHKYIGAFTSLYNNQKPSPRRPSLRK
ncbi:MAG: hypothetical protein ACR2PY_04825 [Salinispira sp.]